METNTSQQAQEPCGCHPGDIEDLACSAERFKKQAAVAEEGLASLTDAQAKFATARADYQAARDKARGDVKEAKKVIDGVLDTLDCNKKITDRDRRCVKEAFEKVVKKIRDCAGESGCCAEKLTFDKEWSCEGDDAPPISELVARIEKYRKQVADSTACFTSLIEEQAKLPERAAAYLAEAKAIKAAYSDDLDKDDLVRLLIRAKVVKWRLKNKQLWRGYTTVNAYVDCLCIALSNAMSGWEAIAVLEGIRAECECKEKARADACKKMQEDMVAEIVAEYVRCCPPDDSDGNGDGDDDCGCKDDKDGGGHAAD